MSRSEGGEGLAAQDGGLGGQRLQQVRRAARAAGQRQQAHRAPEGRGAEAGAVGLDRSPGERPGSLAGRGERLGGVLLRFRLAQLLLAAAPHLPSGSDLQHLLQGGRGVDRRDHGALGERVQEGAGPGEHQVGAHRPDPRLEGVLDPLLGVEQRDRERHVPRHRGDRQDLRGERHAHRRGVDGGVQDRGQEWFEVGRMVLALREDLLRAARLFDRSHDADDLLGGDPPVVETDQHPPDDVVDRRPLHAVEPLQVTAQRPADLGLLLDSRYCHLHGEVPVLARHPTRPSRERRLEHAPGDAGDAPDVPVGDGIRARDQRADRSGAGLGGGLRQLERSAGHSGRGVRRGAGEPGRGAGRLREQPGGQDRGCRGQAGTGHGHPGDRPGRPAGRLDPPEQCHRRPLQTTVAGEATPRGRERAVVSHARRYQLHDTARPRRGDFTTTPGPVEGRCARQVMQPNRISTRTHGNVGGRSATLVSRGSARGQHARDCAVSQVDVHKQVRTWPTRS
jgi:hypothetical protein